MKKKGFLKFGLGVALGVGASMLLNPETGERNRKQLKKKIDKVLDDIKEIDTEEVKDEIIRKVDEIRNELTDLDKEKALDLAKKEAKKVQVKAEELYAYASEKATPLVEKATLELKKQTIIFAKQVIKKLEKEETTSKIKTTKKA